MWRILFIPLIFWQINVWQVDHWGHCHSLNPSSSSRSAPHTHCIWNNMSISSQLDYLTCMNQRFVHAGYWLGLGPMQHQLFLGQREVVDYSLKWALPGTLHHHHHHQVHPRDIIISFCSRLEYKNATQYTYWPSQKAEQVCKSFLCPARRDTCCPVHR